MNKHATSARLVERLGSLAERHADAPGYSQIMVSVLAAEARVRDLEDFIAEVAELPCDPTNHRLNGQCLPCTARYRLAKAAE